MLNIVNGLLKKSLTVGILVVVDFFMFLASLQLAIAIRAQLLPRLFAGIPIAPAFDLGHYLDLWWLPLIWFVILAVEGLRAQRE